MRRRDVLKSAVAGSIALTAPNVVRAQGTAGASSLLKFVPQADLASLDPMWTTADITRNHSLAVFDTLFGIDAKFVARPQMLAGSTTSADGKTWDLTLRDGLTFHDGTPVLARDAVASIKRFCVRDPLGSALAARMDDISAPTDKTIQIKLKTPFALLPDALGAYACAIMPERLAKTPATDQVMEMVGSGPFRFKAAERVPGSLVVYEKFAGYKPRTDGMPSFTAGPKIVNFDRVEWRMLPDPATAAAALANGEVDWWENPTLDLIPSLRRNKDLVIRVTDSTGEIGCLRFNHLYPPFDNPAIRRAVLQACDQVDFMQAVSGAEPSLIKTPVGIFVPGTTYANDAGMDAVKKPVDVETAKKNLAAAGYKGERIVLLAATSFPTINQIALVAGDLLKRIGMNVDYQSMDWPTVVQRRASMEPIDKGGWNIFFTFLGGPGNISPASHIAIRGTGKAAWPGWPTNAKMESLRDAWFAAPDLAAQQALTKEMQGLFFQDPPYVPLGMYDQPTAYRNSLTDVRDGYPQFYGVKKV